MSEMSPNYLFAAVCLAIALVAMMQAVGAHLASRSSRKIMESLVARSRHLRDSAEKKSKKKERLVKATQVSDVSNPLSQCALLLSLCVRRTNPYERHKDRITLITSLVSDISREIGILPPTVAVVDDRGGEIGVMNDHGRASVLKIDANFLDETESLDLSESEWRALLSHELSHIKHNDNESIKLVSGIFFALKSYGYLAILGGGALCLAWLTAGPFRSALYAFSAAVHLYALFSFCMLLVLCAYRKRVEIRCDLDAAIFAGSHETISMARKILDDGHIDPLVRAILLHPCHKKRIDEMERFARSCDQRRAEEIGMIDRGG